MAITNAARKRDPEYLKLLLKGAFKEPDRQPGEIPPAIDEHVAAMPPSDLPDADVMASILNTPEPQAQGETADDSTVEAVETASDPVRDEASRPITADDVVQHVFQSVATKPGDRAPSPFTWRVSEPAESVASAPRPAPVSTPAPERPRRVGRKPHGSPLTQFSANIEVEQAEYLVELAGRETLRIGRKVEMSEIIRTILNEAFDEIGDGPVLKHEPDRPRRRFSR